MLEFERQFWAANPNARLAGIDEAGRGPLAGPVVAAAVAIPEDLIDDLWQGELQRVADSKKLSHAKRDALFALLTTLPGIDWAVGIAESAEIDAVNILRATHRAMARALEALPGGLPAHALVDGLPARGLPCPSTAIVKGDAQSLLIAAASIIAKVTRDRIMDDLDRRHPGYGFARHKGYPTPEHLAALNRLGACPEHRQSFEPVAALKQLSLF
ncbi:MAG: ribonuclease HII [Kiritimatiellia bacterium]